MPQNGTIATLRDEAELRQRCLKLAYRVRSSACIQDPDDLVRTAERFVEYVGGITGDAGVRLESLELAYLACGALEPKSADDLVGVAERFAEYAKRQTYLTRPAAP